MGFFQREAIMPRWKHRMFKIIDTLSNKKFWKGFFEGLFMILGILILIITFWMAMWLFGEDELKIQRKSPSNPVQSNSHYNEP